MATLKDAKVAGGIGAILSLIGIFIPNIGIMLSITGFIMVLIAVKYIADIVNDPLIFRDMLASVIWGVVGVAISTILLFTYFIAILSKSPLFIHGAYPEPMIPRPLHPPIAPIIVLVIAWIFIVASSLYLRRSYSRIGTAIQIDLFKTAATTYFIGALLLIVIVGGIVLLLAKIIEIIAFFSIPEQQPAHPPPPPS